jgi:hypothetical protein
MIGYFLSAPKLLTNATQQAVAIWNTTAGANSMTASAGYGRGGVPSGSEPDKVFDGGNGTYYIAFGDCDTFGINNMSVCGMHTGLHLTLQSGPSLLVAFRLCTGVVSPHGNPRILTIEGSNEPNMNLRYGSSWTLLYRGTSGISNETDPKSFGDTQLMTQNAAWFSSYRILVTSKYALATWVHYSELQLLGYN